MLKNLDFRYKRQELFDISKKDLQNFDFDGIETLVYSNVNLSIFITDYCNASCEFCVAKLRYQCDNLEFIKPTIKDDSEYFERLEKILAFVRPLNPSVSLTGGEPTSSLRIIKIIELLNKYNFRKRTITTNGTYLMTKIGNDTILDILIKNGFQHLNISRAHYDDSKNSKMMLFDAPLELEKISRISKNNIRVRLSCILSKNGVNCVDEMKKYMDFATKYNIDNVVFRELMNYDENKIDKKQKIHGYCEDNRILLNDIWEVVDNDSDFTFMNQVLGYYYYVEVYDYKGIAMVSESADLKKIAKEKEKSTEMFKKHIVYEMIFHPNGCLNGSWREFEDILLNYDRNKL
jgi:molybdenum cofactor biosynthesis enzyme MoaA